METNTHITQYHFNNAIRSMKQLLTNINDMDSTQAQIDYLRVVAKAATSLAHKLEAK
jgi:hypothetical protein